MPYKRSVKLEETLQELEGLIGSVSDKIHFKPTHPIIFIMGCARSGTTLLTQLLARYTNWCYPTNLISRFYFNPYVGALIQRMLVDLDDKGELLGDYEFQIDFSSELGKTKGLLSPHEFWYYWRRFFKLGEIQKLDEQNLEIVKGSMFANGLYAIQTVFKTPLFLKGMFLNWDIPYLAKLFPKARFIYLKRDIRFNAQSLLLARDRFFENRNEWYSFKPLEYTSIKDRTPEEQVVAQVFYTNRSIEAGLSGLDKNRVITIGYEDLCVNLNIHLQRIAEVVGDSSVKLWDVNPIIRNGNKVEVNGPTWERIEAIVREFNN